VVRGNSGISQLRPRLLANWLNSWCVSGLCLGITNRDQAQGNPLASRHALGGLTLSLEDQSLGGERTFTCNLKIESAAVGRESIFANLLQRV
jgi:hypothetical protein